MSSLACAGLRAFSCFVWLFVCCGLELVVDI
jgi:hypothetical protein